MPVNTSDPLGAKARFVLRGSEGINELLTGSIPDGSALTTESTAGGVAIVPSGSWSAWRYVSTDVDPVISGDFTYHWYGVLRDDAAQGFMRVAGASYGWTTGTTSYSPGVLYVYLANVQSGYAKYSDLKYGITDNTLHSITVRYTASLNKVEFFLDNVLFGSGDMLKEAAAMGPEQNFSITGHASKPHKHIVSTVFAEALTDAEIARLVADPFAIFSTAAKTLTAASITQTNVVTPGAVTQPGNLASLPLAQTNTASSGGVTTTQTLTVASVTQTNAASTVSLDPYKRLRNLLKPVAKGEWLQVNTSTFLGCIMPRSDDNPGYIDWTHFAVANAWPSFAWDTDNGNILFWGGGHANYVGNELYIWEGNTGQWKLGSLPSRLDSELFVIGKDAPQSSHTYCNNVYLPNNKMFCTFGGAAAPSGNAFKERTGSDPTTSRSTGPWCFDVSKADSNKVGGATGTGWDTTNVKQGSNAWYNRIDMVDGGYQVDTLTHINSATVVQSENGKDVAYFTMDSGSGFPYWYRYEFGDIRAGERDTFSYLTGTQNSVLYESWGVFDSKRGMFYRGGLGDLSGVGSPAKATELAAVHVSTAVWNSYDTPIRLVDTLGAPLPTNISSRSFGAAYNENDDQLYLWTGWEANPGTYYTVAIPEWDPVTGWAATTWVATKHIPTGPTPIGNYQISILGRMRYVPALKAIAIIDQPRTETAQDASVWMLKTTDAELIYDLTTAGITQVNSIPAISVAKAYSLTAGGISQNNQTFTATITQSHTLAVSAIDQLNTLVAATISQVQNLAVVGILQTNTTQDVELSNSTVHSLVIPVTGQSNVASSQVITQSHVLILSVTTQGNSLASSGIAQTHVLVVAPKIQENEVSEGAIFIAGGPLTVAPVVQLNVVASGVITQLQFLLISVSVQNNSISGRAISFPSIEAHINSRYIAYAYAKNYTAVYDQE